MSDDLANGAALVIGLGLLAGLLNWRAEHAIIHDLGRSAHGGSLHATVNPRGVFGMLAGQASEVIATGHGFATEGLAFKMQRGDGLRAYVGRLSLDLRDFTVRGLPVRQFRADVPHASLDILRAFFDERIIMRGASEGTAEAVVDSEGVRALVLRRYPEAKNLAVIIHPNGVEIEANMTLLGLQSHVQSTYGVEISEGRFLEASRVRMKLNGKEVPASSAASILKSINPVLDIDKDLGMAGYFVATGAEIGEGTITIRGKAHVPLAEDGRRESDSRPRSPMAHPSSTVHLRAHNSFVPLDRSRIYD